MLHSGVTGYVSLGSQARLSACQLAPAFFADTQVIGHSLMSQLDDEWGKPCWTMKEREQAESAGPISPCALCTTGIRPPPPAGRTMEGRQADWTHVIECAAGLPFCSLGPGTSLSRYCWWVGEHCGLQPGPCWHIEVDTALSGSAVPVFAPRISWHHRDSTLVYWERIPDAEALFAALFERLALSW